MKYIKKMKDLGLIEENLKDNLKSQIETINNAQVALKKAKADNDTDKISEIDSDINVMDAELVASLEKYSRQLENIKKMQLARGNKKNAPTQVPDSAPVPVTTPAAFDGGGQTPAPVDPVPADAPPAVVNEDENKEGGSGLGLFVGIVLGAIGLGFLYNKMKS